MNYNHRISALTTIIASLFIVLSSAALANTTPNQSPVIDLASTANSQELIGAMLAIPRLSNVQSLSSALMHTDWVRPDEDNLDAPRQHSTIWLKASVHNSNENSLIRWLVLEPWRMNRVDAYFLDPNTQKILWQKTTGLTVSLQDRAVNNGKTIIPVHLNAGETQQLFIKIYSDSLPFVSVKSWDPVSYSQSINQNWIFQAALFAGILTLLVVLILQFNAGFLLTGLWLLSGFIVEAEKDGFFSNYLLTFLESYSINLRVSAAAFTSQLFLATSVFLLGFNKHRLWRVFLILTAVSMPIIASLTFVLDGVAIRQLVTVIMIAYLGAWLFLVTPVLRTSRSEPAKLLLLLLLSIYWTTTTLALLKYIFNFDYTTVSTFTRISIEIMVAVALILTFNWQQKSRLSTAEKTLKAQESEYLRTLEQAVASRTEELNTALETAKKASTAKVNFLGQVTHDLRSPLTAILGYAQLQAGGAVSAEKATQVIQDRGLYMKDLIDGLVDYAHDITVDDNELQDIYLIAFIDNLVNHSHIIASKQNNRFQLKIETDLPTVVRCSSKQLQRILLNLLDNAAKYTSDGNFSLSVAVADTSGQEQMLIFRVSDTGRGIPADDLKKIYTPFYQSSESNPGAGLGLAICFELTEKLGGTLELESEPGKGTTATCTIPYIAGDEQLAVSSLAAVKDLLPKFDAQGQLAWIVEDSQAVRELLNEEFSDMGFEVTLFTTAEAFIEAAASPSDIPSVIITDYRLPGASGADVLHSARSQWPSVPVALLSGTQNSNPRPEECDSERFNAYLSKPVDRLELRMKVSELCNLLSE
ncbi:hybrid sensor histidine kinase/response regulator [Marinobacter sediminicola]|uniref:hybrid sensor histidine kinase/response regulator n=2 Tax=Marinobacter TaxID=2742 RepID=UPI002810E746|nr:ATP-binding protein [Marinobacter sp. F26243]